MLILSIITCIAGCIDKKENTNNTTTKIENSTDSQNNTTTPSEKPTTEKPTTKPVAPEKEESLIWDGTTVYINDENGMKLFKEEDEEKRISVETAILKVV